MDAEFCIKAFQEAWLRYGTPKIFNTDQSSQFTIPRLTETLEARQSRMSMDGGSSRWLTTSSSSFCDDR